MSPRLLYYIEDTAQAQELIGKVVDSVWFGTYGNIVILFTDGTDISAGVIKGQLVVEHREWRE